MNHPMPSKAILDRIRAGMVIPASPLALTRNRAFDERRQAALMRYYRAAGAGGVAVAVHTTQFAIRDPGIDLLRPVLETCAAALDEAVKRGPGPVLKVAGIVGKTPQAVREAELAASLGYDVGLLSLSAFRDATDDEMIVHAETVAGVIPLFGFYLQPAVGGRILSRDFWRRFVRIPNVVAVKIAPFDRYRTLDVARAVAEEGREGDVALYTGNDDAIVADLITPYRFIVDGRVKNVAVTGGLLGQWAVGTKRAVDIHHEIRALTENGADIPLSVLRRGAELTDVNAAIFDADHRFDGVIAGVHEVLRMEGLFEGIWTLDPREGLSPGQAEEIGRVYAAYPHLFDRAFITEHLDEWRL